MVSGEKTSLVTCIDSQIKGKGRLRNKVDSVVQYVNDANEVLLNVSKIVHPKIVNILGEVFSTVDEEKYLLSACFDSNYSVVEAYNYITGMSSNENTDYLDKVSGSDYDSLRKLEMFCVQADCLPVTYDTVVRFLEEVPENVASMRDQCFTDLISGRVSFGKFLNPISNFIVSDRVRFIVSLHHESLLNHYMIAVSDWYKRLKGETDPVCDALSVSMKKNIVDLVSKYFDDHTVTYKDYHEYDYNDFVAKFCELFDYSWLNVLYLPVWDDDYVNSLLKVDGKVYRDVFSKLSGVVEVGEDVFSLQERKTFDVDSIIEAYVEAAPELFSRERYLLVLKDMVMTNVELASKTFRVVCGALKGMDVKKWSQFNEVYGIFVLTNGVNSWCSDYNYAVNHYYLLPEYFDVSELYLYLSEFVDSDRWKRFDAKMLYTLFTSPYSYVGVPFAWTELASSRC